MSATIPFSELLDCVQPGTTPDCAVARVAADWMQGRSAFGGLSGALALAALRRLNGDERRPLQSMMTAFIGPLPEGEVQVQCRLLRSGRNVAWHEVELAGPDGPATRHLIALGQRRPSGITVPAPVRPRVPPPEDGIPFRPVPGLTPAFIQHFDMRLVAGDLPMSGGQHADTGMWVRFREPETIGEPHLVALMDVLPPAVLQMYRDMRPISTLSWHLDLLAPPPAVGPEDWWYHDLHTQHAADGYARQVGVLYAPSGEAVAISQQSIAVFA